MNLIYSFNYCHNLYVGAGTCADPESFVRGVKHCQGFFLFRGERRYKQANTTISRPSSAFHWHADNGSKLNAALVALWFSGDLDQYC